MKKKIFWHILGIIFISGIVYLPIINGFFAQDEWFVFGDFYNRGFQLVLDGLIPRAVHFIPLTHIVNFLSFKVFDLNYIYYALLSIVLHIISSILTYFLVIKLTKDQTVAMFTALFFGLSASAYQATSWTFTDVATHGAMIFGLISSIFFLTFLNKKLIKYKYLFLSIVALLISLLFKETVVGLFMWFAALILVRQSNKVRSKLSLIVLIFCFTFYIGLRLTGVIVNNINNSKGESTVYLRKPYQIAYTLITLPAKALVQSLVPAKVMYSLANNGAIYFQNYLAVKPGTIEFDRFIEKRVFEVINLFVFIIIILICLLIFKKNKTFTITSLLPALLWIAFNSFVYVLAPEKTGVIFEIESRNLYIPSFGAFLLLVSIMRVLFRKNKLFYLFCLLVFVPHLFSLNGALGKVVTEGKTRRSILYQIRDDYPVLPAKTIFYTESDSSFYGLPVEERTLPFQSGLGQTLLAWYFKTERFPKAFFENRYLWDILEQGYKEVDDRGFGYFRDFELMLKIVIDNKLPIDSVIGYRYSSKTNKLIDMTDEIRGRLRGSLSTKRKIALSTINSIAPQVFDNDRKTKWDSQVPYVTPQSFEVDLNRLIKVSQVEIDSYDNKDQDRVGYSIQLSEDGLSWKEVFYAKKNPPKSNGIVRMPFEPTITRYVKINQLGDHQFASWVINELNIYESLN